MGSKGVGHQHKVAWLSRRGPPVEGQTSQEADSEMKSSVKSTSLGSAPQINSYEVREGNR